MIELIEALLRRDPADEVLADPWLAEGDSSAGDKEAELSAPSGSTSPVEVTSSTPASDDHDDKAEVAEIVAPSSPPQVHEAPAAEEEAPVDSTTAKPVAATTAPARKRHHISSWRHLGRHDMKLHCHEPEE